MWFVYIIVSKRFGSYYVGSTTDVGQRLAKHNSGRGSKHTRSRRPYDLAYSVALNSKSLALKVEAQLKRLTHQQKAEFVTGRFLVAIPGQSHLNLSQRYYLKAAV